MVKGWQESTTFTAEEVIRQLEPYCSRLSLHLRGQRRHDAGHRSRLVPPSARRNQAWRSRPPAVSPPWKIFARCTAMNIHCAVGMAIYTGRLDLAELAAFPNHGLTRLRAGEHGQAAREPSAFVAPGSVNSNERGYMKVWPVVLLLSGALAWGANETLDRAHRMEDAGHSSAAREALVQAVESASSDAELLTGYADFLERSHDAGARRLIAEAPKHGKKKIRIPMRPPPSAAL